MKIIRDGKEYELTDRELCSAYYEQQAKFDAEDVQDAFDQLDDDQLLAKYRLPRGMLNRYVEDIAALMRKYINKYDMDWECARSDAIMDCLRDKVGPGTEL